MDSFESFSGAESLKSHYQLLGVGISATEEEIRKVYRWKARGAHPDKNIGVSHAEELMKRLNKAYETLTDTIKREDYDEQMDESDMMKSNTAE